MNYAIILAGGTGSRMNLQSIPKQYIEVNGRPIISYAIEKFENHKKIDKIVVVVSKEWKKYVIELAKKERFLKMGIYAEAGSSRQMSIYNGLQAIKDIADDEDIVVVHDAARPCVDDMIITECLNGASVKDGAMPVIAVKDTIYVSKDGNKIDSLLNRDELYAGQAPESFKFGKYIKLHDCLSKEEIDAIRGSSELAYKGGMDIAIVKGSESNFKITTIEDLEKFKLMN